MGLTKTEIFTDDQNAMAQIAKALGHPARIAILQHLLHANTCVCGDLVKEIGLAQATISQHLRELKKVNLIQGTIEGTSVCYCINPIVWKEVERMFAMMFTQFKNDNTCC